MSKLEKTAPNEIYLIVGDADKDCNFNELAEVTWADEPIYEETSIRYVKSSQLTIPKSIADELDKVPFHNPNENGYICVAYLAGKALGVDLVKVVEGIDDNY